MGGDGFRFLSLRSVLWLYLYACFHVLCVAGAGSEELMFSYDSSRKVLTIRRPGISILEDFTITVYDS